MEGDVLSLNLLWFILVGALFTGYAMLDGFDLGAGMLIIFGKNDKDRRLILNSIGPVWDGNEVWLVTGGGALFAAFPNVYATILSGFYIPFMLLLFAIIFRAIAIEFRSKQSMLWWRYGWDWAFCLSSFLSSVLIGVAVGNIAWGVFLDEVQRYDGTFLDLLGFYPIIIGLTTVTLFLMHGCMYIVLKTEGDLQKQFRSYVNRLIGAFLLFYLMSAGATMLWLPHMVERFQDYPWLAIVPLVNVLVILNIPREIHKGNDFKAFACSCAAMLTLMLNFGIGLFPDIVVARDVGTGVIDYANSLNIWNAASSQKTLGIMAIIAAMGVPLVLTYTVSIYWVFRGKVKINEHSY